MYSNEVLTSRNIPMNPSRHITLCLMLCIAGPTALGGEELAAPAKFTELKPDSGLPAFTPQLCEKGELLIPPTFEDGEYKEGEGPEYWTVGNGKWKVEGNIATAMRSEGDDHSAGLRSDIGQLPDRFILEFKFRYEADDANQEGKHKFNLRVMGNGKALVLHPTSDSVSARTMKAEGGTHQHFEKKADFEINKWHSVMVEVKDEEGCIQISGVGQFEFRHEQIKKRKKKFFVFNIGKARASVKDVSFWAVK